MNDQERAAFESWAKKEGISSGHWSAGRIIAQAAWQARAALAAKQAQTVTEDMKSAVRWAPSSAYWSERLREFFGPDARDGIACLEKQLREAQALAAAPQAPAVSDYIAGIHADRLLRALTVLGSAAETSFEALAAPDVLAEHVNRLSRLVVTHFEKAAAPQAPAVPDGYKLLKDTTHDERRWHEDAKHENGSYYNECVRCLRSFVGHKRRGVCRACAQPEVAPAAQPAPQAPLTEFHNPWRIALENCITGDNYLRASEYRQLIEELDVLYRLRAAGVKEPT